MCNTQSYGGLSESLIKLDFNVCSRAGAGCDYVYDYHMVLRNTSF